MSNDLHERLAEISPDMLTVDGFDDAILGYADCWGVAIGGGGERLYRVVYSVRRIVEALVAAGMDEESAMEYFEFNIAGAYLGPNTPVYMYDLED